MLITLVILQIYLACEKQTKSSYRRYHNIRYPLLPSLQIIHCCPDNIPGWLTSFICSVLLKPLSKRNEYSSVLYIAPSVLLSTAGSTARVPTLGSLWFGFCKPFFLCGRRVSRWLVALALREEPAALLSWQKFHRVSKPPSSAVIKGFCLSCEICPVNADTD